MLPENVRAGFDPACGDGGWASPFPARNSFFLSGYLCQGLSCSEGNVDYRRANDRAGDPFRFEAVNSSLNQPEGEAPWPSSYHSGGVAVNNPRYPPSGFSIGTTTGSPSRPSGKTSISRSSRTVLPASLPSTQKKTNSRSSGVTWNRALLGVMLLATILLSGGHSVDKMCWWLDDAMPTKAVALGSRVFPSEGNTFDNAFVVYEYADGLRGFLGCRTHSGCYSENADYVIGTTGTCTIGRGRVPVIEGETKWRYPGPPSNMYQTEHDEFLASIRAGQPINDGTRMAHTTLMTLMGRMAAYTGKEITWEQALNSQQSLMPEKLDWEMKLDQPPLAVPGLTELV